MMNTVEVKAALKAKDAEIRSLVRGGKELQKTIDKLRKTVEKLDKPKKHRELNSYNLKMREILLRPEVKAIGDSHERMRRANQIRKEEQPVKGGDADSKLEIVAEKIVDKVADKI
jgi:uncharacterized protein YPO0396